MSKILKKLTLNKEIITKVSDNQMGRLWGGYDDQPTRGLACSEACSGTCITECDDTCGGCDAETCGWAYTCNGK